MMTNAPPATTEAATYFHRTPITELIGKSIGLRLGVLWRVDRLPYEEFLNTIRRLTNDLVMGTVSSVKVSMRLHQETCFIVALSCHGQGGEGAGPSSFQTAEGSSSGSCTLKAGVLSGIMNSYLKRESDTQEVLCGVATRDLCLFETRVR